MELICTTGSGVAQSREQDKTRAHLSPRKRVIEREAGEKNSPPPPFVHCCAEPEIEADVVVNAEEEVDTHNNNNKSNGQVIVT